DNEDLRLNAAIALGAVGKPAVGALEEQLADKNEDVRYYAVWALGLAGPEAKGAAGPVIRLLAAKNDSVRRKAAYGRGPIPPDAAGGAPVLIKGLADDNEDVRQAAAEAVAHLGKEVVPALVKVIKDAGAKPLPRQFAARAIGLIGSDAADAIAPLGA